jgi:hypothetical protein
MYVQLELVHIAKKSEKELPLGQYFADFSVSFEANAFLSIYSES